MDQWIKVTITTLFGLAIGSFLNVLIWRLNDQTAPKFWRGRSLCPKCKHVLSWQDNIPLLSFVLLGRRCRHCKTEISWQYPLVETLTVLATLVVWQFSGGVSPIVKLLDCFIIYSFIVIFFSDWIYGLIPDEAVAAGIVLSFLRYLSGLSILKVATATGFFSAAFFFLIVLVTKFRGMGLGDVKLAFLIGFLLGWPKTAVAFWAAFVLGGLVAVTLVLLKKVRFSDTISFGPYLVLGTLISALWSDRLLQLVLR